MPKPFKTSIGEQGYVVTKAEREALSISDIDDGTMFFEEDTGLFFEKMGNAFFPRNDRNMIIKASEEISVNMYHDHDTITISASTTPVIVERLEPYDEIEFTIERSGTTDTIACKKTNDGNIFGPALRPHDYATGATAASAALGPGTYGLPINGKGLSFQASGVTDDFTISWHAKVTNRTIRA